MAAADRANNGRANQRRRTRKDLLDAASRLVREGHKPSLEEVAEAALVSRATAYRYFPNVEALLVEAALDIAAPTAADLFGDGDDPVERVQRVDGAFDDMIARNETPLRLMLANALQHAASSRASAAPVRQNRRTPLIEAALAPARDRMAPDGYRHLVRTLALLVGTESMVVFRDVLQVGDREARKTKRWAIRVLVEAALRRDRGAD